MLVPDPEMTDGERIKILDFGVAKFLEGQPGLGSDHSSLTNADSRLGTPLFMSPEQCRNSSEVTDRADIYSLGVLCYWLLSGVHPFRGATDMAIIMQHLTATARPLQELVPNTPQPVCELVEAMLAKAPNERPSARDVINVLAPLLRGPLSYNGLPTVGSTTPEAVERMPRLPAPFSGGYAVIPTAAAPTAATSGSFPAPSPAAVPTAATSGSFPAPSLATSAAAVAPGSPAGPPVAAPIPTTEPSTGQAADGEALRFPQILPAAPPRTQRHARIDPDSTAKTESVIGALGRVAVLARESVSDGDKPAAPRHQVLTPIAPPPKRWARPVAIAAGVLAILGLVLWLLLGGQ